MWTVKAVDRPTPGFTMNYWYVYNVRTEKKKKIGRVSMTGINYFDRAADEAKTRNLCDYGEKVVLIGNSLYDADGNYVREYK